MPYLEQNMRDEILDKGELNTLAHYLASLDFKLFLGALNYVVCYIVKVFRQQYNSNQLSYWQWAGIDGTLDCAKTEIYRRWVAPYEDKKCKENGDV